MSPIETVGAADGEPDGVYSDRVRLTDPLERPQTGPAGRHVVLGVDLEPRDGGTGGKDLAHVHRPKADPGRGLETFTLARGHRRPSPSQPCFGCMLPPTTFSQEPLGRYTQASPWPLRFEVPAHEEFAVWQSFLPALAMP